VVGVKLIADDGSIDGRPTVIPMEISGGFIVLSQDDHL
jgi:hypothetical protein